jgi:hypothetical protein
MRIVRKVLIGLGVVFALIIAFFVWLGVLGARFKSAETPFVTQFVTDLSRHWNPDDVSDRSATSLIEQARSAQGRQVLEHFKQLGALRSAHDLVLRNYNLGTNGVTAVLSMKASFQNGDATVDVTLHKQGGALVVTGFYLREIRMHAHAAEKTVAAPRPAAKMPAIIVLPS